MSKLPSPLVITITAKHISSPGKRTPLELAVAEALAPYEVKEVRVSEDNVLVWRSHPRRHDAKYYIPDDAWKHAAKVKLGKRVKPAEFTLPAVYIAHDTV